MAIISLICNVKRTSTILERAFRVLNREQINVQARARAGGAGIGHGSAFENTKARPRARAMQGGRGPCSAVAPASAGAVQQPGGVLTRELPCKPSHMQLNNPRMLLPPPPTMVLQMMSQGASKTNIALIVNDTEAKEALRALHEEFFGTPN